MPNGNVIAFEGNTAFRTFKLVDGEEPPETGEITGAGEMNSSFKTDMESTIVINDDEWNSATGTGLLVLRHTDRYTSKNKTHLDSNLGKVSDTFDVEYTIVAINAPPLPLRVTFNGPLIAGTGTFAGATGIFNGYGFQVESNDPAVAVAFTGRIGGAIRPASG